MLNSEILQRLSADWTQEQLREFYKTVEAKRREARKLLCKIRAAQS